MNSVESELLTVPEAATFLRLKAATIRAWILHRRIPHVKLGRRVYLRRSDLKALIAASIVSARGFISPSNPQSGRTAIPELVKQRLIAISPAEEPGDLFEELENES